MDGWRAIAKAQFWIIRNHIKRIEQEPFLKVLLIVSSIFLFWFGALALFYRGFRFLNRFPFVGSILVDEAIYLADRVFVMSSRPGTILNELEIALPRPRSEDITCGSAFLDYRMVLLESLGV